MTNSDQQPKRGQPPKDGVPATGQIQLRVTMARKNAYVRAAKPKSLSAWMFANLDPIAKYEPTEYAKKVCSNVLTRATPTPTTN